MLALVTGASSGIGKALVKLLRSKGYTVVSVSRCLDQIEGDKLHYDMATLVDYIKQHSPAIVVHAAGFGLYGYAVDHTIDQLQQLMQVHVEAVLTLAKALHAACEQHHLTALLLVVSSIAGEMPTPGMALYGACKAAATHLCQSLDEELSSKGVRVLACCPGQVKSAFASRAANREYHHPWWVMSADKAAKLIYKQIKRKKPKQIIDWKYQLFSMLWPLLPQKMIKQKLLKGVLSR